MKRYLCTRMATQCLGRLIFITALLSSCSPSSEQSNLPAASGRAGEMVVVIDSLHWQGEVGKTVRQVLAQPIPGLFPQEPLFTLLPHRPIKINSLVKRARHLIIIHILNNRQSAGRQLARYFTTAALQKMQKSPPLFYHLQRDVFAKGQTILYLFSQNESLLIKNLQKYGEKFVHYLQHLESQRLAQMLFKDAVKPLAQEILNRHHFHITIPQGYQLAVDAAQFVWVRKPGESDKNIFIAYKDYSDTLLYEQIIQWRNQIVQKYIRKDSTVYMITESLVPTYHTTINFHHTRAIESRGLWKLTDLSLGGPFLSYAWADEKQGRWYYIEGFVASPGTKKRALLREMEVILRTFSTGS